MVSKLLVGVTPLRKELAISSLKKNIELATIPSTQSLQPSGLLSTFFGARSEYEVRYPKSEK